MSIQDQGPRTRGSGTQYRRARDARSWYPGTGNQDPGLKI